MGNWNSGRRPQPRALKVLRGNPGKRRLRDEATLPPADPSFDTPPAELAHDTRAAAEWRRVAPLLRAVGLVTEAERSALIALCQQWSAYLGAHKHVLDNGIMCETSSGKQKLNPYLVVMDRALAHCSRLWQELGLTPTGRARAAKLPAAPDTPDHKWAGILP